MRNATDPHLVEAILHQVQPRSGATGPTLSDIPLTVADQPDEVRAFLRHHIEKGLNDPRAVASRFKGQDLDVAMTAASLLRRDSFVEASQELADRLFAIAEEDGRIPDGTIVFALYVDHPLADGQEIPDEALRAAILKLDPSSQFRSTATTNPEGQKQVRFRQVTGVLPSVRERLQKSAFFRTYAPDLDYQLIVLDRQTAGGAQWFTDTFFESEPALDAAERVERFYRAVSQVEASLRQAGQDREARSVLRARDQALRDEEISVETFVANRTELDAEQKQNLRIAITKHLPDPEFKVDRQRADRLLRKASYVGDHGLRVSVEQESRDEMITVSYSPADNLHTVVIRTRTWEER
jgi:hypothetical protein